MQLGRERARGTSTGWSVMQLGRERARANSIDGQFYA